MYTEGFDQWLKLNKNMTLPMNEWNKATTDAFKHLTEQNLEIISDNFSQLSDQFRRLSSVRKPEELLHLQKEVANENINLLLKNMEKVAQATLESIEELGKLVKESTKESISAVKATAKHQQHEKDKR